MTDWIWRNVFAVDWHDAFDPHVALLGIVLRGTVIYLVLFALLRVTRRHSGEMGMSDVLVIVLIADAVQNGMSGESRSITEGLALALTIFFWSWLLEWLPVRFPRSERWLSAPARTVVRDGVVDRRALRRELMTEAELMAQLRLQGIDGLEDVCRARIEGNGEISVRRRTS